MSNPMRRLSRFLAASVLGACLVTTLPAQVAPAPFSLRSQQGANVQLLSDGGTITFSSEGVGLGLSATVALTYTGRTTAQINSLDSIGSTDFSVGQVSAQLPLTMNPNDAMTFVIQYTPSALGKATGTLRINYTEGRTNANVTVNLVGVQPDFGFSFTVPKGNQTSIADGGTISFPDTTVNLANPSLSQISSATFAITNRGSGPGTVNNIAVTGAVFTLSSVPLLPAVVQPAATLTFTINFAPTQLTSSSGSVKIDFVTRSVNVNLAGSGVGSVFLYEFTVGSSTRAVSGNDTLTLPQITVGDKTATSTATLRVRNTGNADGIISAIASSDAQFALSNLPFLPATLHAGDSITFTISFTPSQPGTVTARLRIDAVSFNLTGVGLGASLSYTATVGTATSTLVNNGNLIFSPTPVAASSSATVQVSNTGNTATFVNSISVSGPAGVFSLAGLPALPVRIDGGASVSFSAVFGPAVLGAASGTLKIDNQTFNLSGVGTDPPLLPAVTFSGAGASTDAAQQIAVGISLASPYPVQLDGKLALAFTSDVFSDDPSIQFATGGRTVNFVVPANGTQALFSPNNATQVRLQTGTVAGTITLAAQFVTDAGGINLTPNALPGTTIRVQPSGPRIRSVQVSNVTASGFSVLVTGYAPTRAVNKMDFQFTAFSDPSNPNLKLDTTSLSVDAQGPFSSWYQSAASQAFGSLFTATVTFSVRGDINAIQSVAVTMTTTGFPASNSMSAALR